MDSELERTKKIKESLTVRGVCGAIQNMALPTIQNLIDLFEKAGVKLEVKK